MIRIAHLSDSHFDERGRLQDVIDVHRAFLEQAGKAEVDLIVHAGDWFERRSTPLERIAVADFLTAATENVAPVFGVKGNHDAADDLDIFNRLETYQAVKIMDRPSAVPGSATVLPLAGRGRLVGLLALPWFDKAHLVAGLDASVDAQASRELTMAAARDLLTCLRAEATRLRGQGTVPILVGHVLVAGSETSSGQTLIGTTVELAPGDIASVGAAYAALGHIHLPQEWAGGRVAYSGSPHRSNFGEPESKGWRLVTLTDDGEFVSNEFRELPARRMIRLEADWTSDEEVARLTREGIELNCFAIHQRTEINGALVRFRYHIRARDLHLVDASVIRKVFEADGAEEIQIEAVVNAEPRVRSELISTATTTAEKVDAWLAAKAIQVDEPTHARLHNKLGELEGADHATA